VYLEKPCSHNPNEGELLISAANKYKRVMQMGNQRRSWPNVNAAIKELHAGVIGRPYFAKTWYTNNRPSIGTGKETEVPAWLNYDLWQGPAPRKPYRDNLIHYNWHWFWHWGTGEALNNGTHMVDLARWGLDVTYPTTVSSSGGRYRYQDDWETPDTQVINLTFGNKAMITWEGRSCNGKHVEENSVGVVFYAENGSMTIESGNSYKIHDLKNKLVKEVKDGRVIDVRNLPILRRNWMPIISRTFLTVSVRASLLSQISSAGTRVLCLYSSEIFRNVPAAHYRSIQPMGIS
jgi:predicted dehydrogenase